MFHCDVKLAILGFLQYLSATDSQFKEIASSESNSIRTAQLTPGGKSKRVSFIKIWKRNKTIINKATDGGLLFTLNINIT